MNFHMLCGADQADFAGIGDEADDPLFAAGTDAGAFAAAPDDPYEFLQGMLGFTAWLGLAKPRPAYEAPALRASYRGRRERLPPYPLAAGGKERVSWLPPTFKLTAPALAACGGCARGLLLALRSLNAREHLGHFRAALQPRRGILRCRFIASARGTKSLPCGLRARGRPARNERVQADTDRDHLSVSAN